MVGAELGQSRDPRALVPGDPAALRAHADALSAHGDSLLRVGDGLRRVDTGAGWSGQAADAFRQKLTPYPTQWLTAGDSHHAATAALTRYAETLDWAQRQAGAAAARWDEAQAATTGAASRYNANSAHGVAQRPFVDPGAEARAAAQDALARAREQLASAGDAAASSVTKAASVAPTRPIFTDAMSTVTHTAADVGNGLASWLNAVVCNPAAFAEAAGGTAVAGVGALVTGASGVLDAGVVTAPVGLLAGAGGIGMMGGGLAVAAHGLGSIAAHASTDDRVEPLGTGDSPGIGSAPSGYYDPITAPDGSVVQPPREISGWTQHAREQAEGRDGGAGVTDEAAEDAVHNTTKKVTFKEDPYGGSLRYYGKDATVALNRDGEVVTAWAKSRAGRRNN